MAASRILLIVNTVFVFLYLLCQFRFLLLALLDGLLPAKPETHTELTPWPEITIQLAVYREHKILRNLLLTLIALEAPRKAFTIQVLDDSTGMEAKLTRGVVDELASAEVTITYINRGSRSGFKAGALNHGLAMTSAELVVFFDADCVPKSNFLKRTVSHFADPTVAAVQARWDYPEALCSPLTQMQAAIFEWLFRFEILLRAKLEMPVFYMGTAAIWRRQAIQDLGGWQEEPLTCEDLDLAYRAAIRGWRVLYQPEVLASNTAIEQVLAFRAQQRRWARSLLQVGYDNFPAIRRAHWPLWAKLLEFSMLLTHGMPGVLLAATLLSALAVVLGIDRTPWWFTTQCIFTASFLLSPAMATLILVQRSLHQDWRRRTWALLRSLPAAMGMTTSFVFGMLDFIRRRPGEFTSTPKGGAVGVVEGSSRKWLFKQVSPLVFEGAAGTFTALSAVIAAVHYPEACVVLGSVGCATLVSFGRTLLAVLGHAARLRSTVT